MLGGLQRTVAVQTTGLENIVRQYLAGSSSMVVLPEPAVAVRQYLIEKRLPVVGLLRILPAMSGRFMFERGLARQFERF